MVSERIYDLCQSSASVSSELAKDPQKTPGELFTKLFPKLRESGRRKKSSERRDAETVGALKRASECGQWGGNHPSGLFLQVCNPPSECDNASLSVLTDIDSGRYITTHYVRSRKILWLG